MLRTDADNEATAHEILPFFVALYIPLNITDAKNPISVRGTMQNSAVKTGLIDKSAAPKKLPVKH